MSEPDLEVLVRRTQAGDLAVEQWLVSHGHVRIHQPSKQNQEALPYFRNS
ncbi:MAG: hypothetical protein IT578_09390 [Verrucomicrobiae bacterium]|nr:hypothetical protein [Verrucomicrobiae bacterium]